MIIVMNAGAPQTDIDRVVGKVMEKGLKVHLSEGRFVTIIGVVGDKTLLNEVPLLAMNGVDKVVPITSGYKLASRQFRPENSVIDVGGVQIGGDSMTVMAGPLCGGKPRTAFGIRLDRKERGREFFARRSL